MGTLGEGRVSESGLTGAISEVTSDHWLLFSPPQQEAQHRLYCISAITLLKPGSLIGPFSCMSARCFHVQSELLQVATTVHAHVWPFHNALGQAQMYCTAPCALR